MVRGSGTTFLETAARFHAETRPGRRCRARIALLTHTCEAFANLTCQCASMKIRNSSTRTQAPGTHMPKRNFTWLRPSDANNLEGVERCCLRLALERLHQTDQCVFKRCAPRSSSSTSPLRRSAYRRHSCGSAFRQFNATSVHTGFLSCPTDWVSFSGNEHSLSLIHI